MLVSKVEIIRNRLGGKLEISYSDLPGERNDGVLLTSPTWGFRFFNTENDATKEGKELVDAIIKHEYARIAEIEKTIQELEALDVTAPPKKGGSVKL